MNMEDMMTITEAAARLKVARAAVYEAIRAGYIRAETMLGRQVVNRQDVERYVPRAYQGKREKRGPAGVRGPGGRPKKTVYEDGARSSLEDCGATAGDSAFAMLICFSPMFCCPILTCTTGNCSRRTCASDLMADRYRLCAASMRRP